MVMYARPRFKRNFRTDVVVMWLARSLGELDVYGDDVREDGSSHR
jgi:hypothetical protein